MSSRRTGRPWRRPRNHRGVDDSFTDASRSATWIASESARPRHRNRSVTDDDTASVHRELAESRRRLTRLGKVRVSEISPPGSRSGQSGLQVHAAPCNGSTSCTESGDTTPNRPSAEKASTTLPRPIEDSPRLIGAGAPPRRRGRRGVDGHRPRMSTLIEADRDGAVAVDDDARDVFEIARIGGEFDVGESREQRR